MARAKRMEPRKKVGVIFYYRYLKLGPCVNLSDCYFLKSCHELWVRVLLTCKIFSQLRKPFYDQSIFKVGPEFGHQII